MLVRLDYITRIIVNGWQVYEAPGVHLVVSWDGRGELGNRFDVNRVDDGAF